MLNRFGFWAAIVVGAGAALADRASADGPSFDCQAAGTSVETAICDSPALAALDSEMVRLYAMARDASGDAGKDGLLAEQRRWIAERNSCEDWGDGVEGCVRAAYGKRILDLRHAYPVNRALDAGAITSGVFALQCDSGKGGFVGVFVASPDPIYVLRWDASLGVLSRWETDPLPKYVGIDTGPFPAGDTITLIEADDGLRLTIGDTPEDRCSAVWAE